MECIVISSLLILVAIGIWILFINHKKSLKIEDSRKDNLPIISQAHTSAMNQPSTDDMEVVIPAEQWAEKTEAERAKIKTGLQEIFGKNVKIRIGTPPPNAIKFGADGTITQTPPNAHSKKPYVTDDLKPLRDKIVQYGRSTGAFHLGLANLPSSSTREIPTILDSFVTRLGFYAIKNGWQEISLSAARRIIFRIIKKDLA